MNSSKLRVCGGQTFDCGITLLLTGADFLVGSEGVVVGYRRGRKTPVPVEGRFTGATACCGVHVAALDNALRLMF